MDGPPARVLLSSALAATPTAARDGKEAGSTSHSVDQNWPSFRGRDASGVLEGHPTLTEWSQFIATGERLTQGLINVLGLERSMAGVCTEAAELTVTGECPFEM